MGIGVDVHPLRPDRPLFLAGLFWPDQDGLAGHSDGDVAAHAACDALLSAAGLGDLGGCFGTAEPEWAGATGADLLAAVAKLVANAGYRVGNVAIAIVGNRPQIAARRAEAEGVFSTALGGVPVTIAGTTTDGLGLTGRGEGVAAIATAVVAAVAGIGDEAPARAQRPPVGDR